MCRLGSWNTHTNISVHNCCSMTPDRGKGAPDDICHPCHYHRDGSAPGEDGISQLCPREVWELWLLLALSHILCDDAHWPHGAGAEVQASHGLVPTT